MPRVTFAELPDHGRLWVFPASRDLTVSEAETFMGAVDTFLDRWAAHGVPLRSGRELRDNRFLVVGVDVDAEAPSGCSIDALVNQLRELGKELGVTVVDHASVWYRGEADIESVSRPQFKSLAQAGQVDAATNVFDTSLTRIDELRSGRLERPAADSWHGRAFFEDSVEA